MNQNSQPIGCAGGVSPKGDACAEADNQILPLLAKGSLGIDANFARLGE
jgi:hypothetical protein